MSNTFLVTEKKVMHLNKGDDIYNTLIDQPIFDKITAVRRSDDAMEDIVIETESGSEIYTSDVAKFLVRTPMPEMEAKEYLKQKGIIGYESIRFSTQNGKQDIHVIDLLTEFASLPKQTEWVSVEKELPKEGEVVLAYESGLNDDGMAMAYMKDGKWYDSEQQYDHQKDEPYHLIMDKVTHWLPLPHPPKSNQ